jgi:hypothetical protein
MNSLKIPPLLTEIEQKSFSEPTVVKGPMQFLKGNYVLPATKAVPFSLERYQTLFEVKLSEFVEFGIHRDVQVPQTTTSVARYIEDILFSEIVHQMHKQFPERKDSIFFQNSEQIRNFIAENHHGLPNNSMFLFLYCSESNRKAVLQYQMPKVVSQNHKIKLTPKSVYGSRILRATDKSIYIFVPFEVIK